MIGIETGVRDADETGAAGEPDEMRVVLCSDLALDGVVMVPDRLLAEVEQFGNRVARHSRGEQAQDFRFAWAQVLDHAARSGQPVGRDGAGDILAQESSSAGDSPDGGQQVLALSTSSISTRIT